MEQFPLKQKQILLFKKMYNIEVLMRSQGSIPLHIAWAPKFAARAWSQGVWRGPGSRIVMCSSPDKRLHKTTSQIKKSFKP
jgi:hypothetical protein